MNRTNLFAVAAVALGLFACGRNADRAFQTNTTSASQSLEPDASVNADAKDGGLANMNPNAQDGGALTRSGTTDTDMNAKDGGYRVGFTSAPR